MVNVMEKFAVLLRKMAIFATITGLNGTIVTGYDQEIFDSALLPEQFASILYDTSTGPNSQLKHMPADRASVFLDFSRPQLSSFIVQPGEPTRNSSNWFVTGETEPWSISLSTRLTDFFANKATRIDWLHRSATYEVLLLTIGLCFVHCLLTHGGSSRKSNWSWKYRPSSNIA
jgi:hypothetical protein